jgi:hypothetical protein
MTISPPPSVRTSFLRAELRCYLCAETVGVVESDSTAAVMPRVARFRPSDGSADCRVAWRSLQCSRCGSPSLYLDEPETIVRREERLEWLADAPRRGRPPRWLVALRAQGERL